MYKYLEIEDPPLITVLEVLSLAVSLIHQITTSLTEGPMNSMKFIGLDVHKKTIAYCIKQQDGAIIDQGTIDANRQSLSQWVKTLQNPWTAAMEATLFTSWIYDFLMPFAVEIKVAHPEMLKAIGASKKKNDKIDAEMIADLLRCDLLPECYMISKEYRDLRRILRYRSFLVKQAISVKTKISGLLMEVGALYNKQKLHGERYFNELLENAVDIPESVVLMLRLNRTNLEMLKAIQKKITDILSTDLILKERIDRLMSIRGVGKITALTWALEIEDPMRFSSVSKAVSYCGLCSAQRESAGKSLRGPISKKRNKHLQTVLIEAAKTAPLWNKQLAAFHEKELKKGHKNRATLAVARKIVAYMLYVDKNKEKFIEKEQYKRKAA